VLPQWRKAQEREGKTLLYKANEKNSMSIFSKPPLLLIAFLAGSLRGPACRMVHGEFKNTKNIFVEIYTNYLGKKTPHPPDVGL
jgi:hypothetical protein